MPGKVPILDFHSDALGKVDPSTSEPVRVVHVVTTAYTTEFMRGQLEYLNTQGYQVTVVTSPDARLEEIAKREGIQIRTVKMVREMRPLQDAWALFKLYFILREIRPHVVNASTPKAGLLGMLAACLLFVPLRIYTLRGLRLETTQNWRRLLLNVCERITAICAHYVVCVSPSLQKAYLELKLTRPNKTLVLGHGSSNGVDAAKFRRTPRSGVAAKKIRKQFGISEDARVLGFVGRLTCDKGVGDALEVFGQLQKKFPDLNLFMVGGFEKGDAVSTHIRQCVLENPKIHLSGMIDVNDIAPYYQAIDLLLFPSLREGFPNAVLEAQASELPVVGYAATGTLDAIDSPHTGRVVAIGDRAGLEESVSMYLADEEMRHQHGVAGRQRVEELFRPRIIWKALGELYQSELRKFGLTQEKPLLGRKTHVDVNKAAA